MFVQKRYILLIISVLVLVTGIFYIAGPIRHWLSTQAVPVGSAFSVTSTGYASSPHQTDATPCVTAAGTVVRPGVVATNFLPFGTLLTIESDDDYQGRVFIVEDRTNARYTNRLDLWFPKTSDAFDHGVRQVDIKVVGYGTPGQDLNLQLLGPDGGDSSDPSSLTIFQRAGLELAAVSRLFTKYLGAGVNQYDVDCSKIEAEATN